MARIFLNYRRGDASGPALRLERELSRSFGAGNVFLAIAWGKGDEARIRPVDHGLGTTDALLVLIGPDWFQRDASGQPLIYDPDDKVRLQIESALTLKVRVIPVLINDAELPPTDELPGAIRALAYLPKARISELAWDDDVSELVRRLKGSKAIFEIGSEAAEQVMVGGSLVQPPAAERLPTMFEKAAFAGIVPAWPHGTQPYEAIEPQTAPPPRRSGGGGGGSADLWSYREPTDWSGTNLEGFEVEAYDGGIGRVDEATNEVGGSYLVVDTGPWIFGRKVMLPASVIDRVDLDEQRVWVNRTKDEIKNSPEFDEATYQAEGRSRTGADVEPTAASGDTVECTVFAPPSASPGEGILVQVFAHLPEQADVARAIAMELDTDAHRRSFRSLEVPVPLGGRLQFELRLPGLEVDDPVTSLIWRRRAEAVQFGVWLPPETPAGAVIGTVEISLDSAPIGHVKFKLTVDPLRRPRQLLNEPQGEQARRYRAAFISYASSDRAKVLARVQMLSIVGIRYFQDLLSLEPGDRWEKKLELGIDECDLFLLFWSAESKRSEWVRREVRYALDRRGADELSPPEIRPVLLEGPPMVEPWDELAHLHFNDRLLYFMRPTDRA